MKYFKKFDNISSAKAAEDLVSPNVTTVLEGSSDTTLLIDCGDNKPLEIVGNSINDLAIQEKIIIPKPANNQVWYKTIDN